MIKDLFLSGKTAIVTGGGGGIGRAIALGLSHAGANVLVNDLGVSVSGDSEARNPADTVVEEIEAQGGRASANHGSVAEAKATEKMVEQALDTFGSIDIVINNAGIIRMGEFPQMSRSDWEAVLRVNLQGSFYLSRAAAPHFRAQAGGAYLHLTSASGLIGSTSQANYAASKLGIVGLSRAIALDLGQHGVRSNCLAPSSTSRMTELTDNARKHLMSPEKYEALKRMRAASAPERIVPLIAYLVSDRARGINGQVFGARGNEIYLYGQHRPVRMMHAAEGWTPAQADERLPAGLGAFATPLEVITDVFTWPPA
ncbi:short-chain dehydrogenase [Nitratireductor indicus C115]|uniref:Short-chain dehydrogenase n=1 Tax=Nitratireductor indicus C115 TaxID=1231190 RepID=K2N2K1_9HYPH|nr:SDR family NAD(P)-dependent oxidoreductase [Nitratireductor indicus]EKF41628.1 short-chain dehydrogenase [Nitratireductor indicus C115]SFQ70606.1 NAD(P)-dependent dehydrogenase, short-chain alcohol dehydrogenase family [Nitratireductor indicus]